MASNDAHFANGIASLPVFRTLPSTCFGLPRYGRSPFFPCHPLTSRTDPPDPNTLSGHVVEFFSSHVINNNGTGNDNTTIRGPASLAVLFSAVKVSCGDLVLESTPGSPPTSPPSPTCRPPRCCRQSLFLYRSLSRVCQLCRGHLAQPYPPVRMPRCYRCNAAPTNVLACGYPIMFCLKYLSLTVASYEVTNFSTKYNRPRCICPKSYK